MKIVIRNGHVIDPMNNISQIYDVYIADGKITKKFEGPFDKEINAQDKYVFPGLIDAHCHLRDPGLEYKENIVSGTKSAAKGGFTSVLCMPNTLPVCDNSTVVEYIKSKAKKHASTNVFPIGAISKGEKGEELAEIGLMAKEGIVAVSDDGRPVLNSDMMMKAMKYANDFDLLCISHCEDLSLAKDAHMNESYISTMMGLKGNPSISEDIMVSRDILISEYTGIPVHIAHISTKGSVNLIRQAKKRGVKVTCETCPHYFTLTQEECLGYNTLAKVNPPLKTQEDVNEIIEGIKDGTIDIIATDHAPHHEDEKNIEFSLASNGIAGFETAFGLSYTYLVNEGIISLEKLIELMSSNPSNIFKLGRGNLSYGSPADIMIADLKDEFEFKKDKMLSKSTNSPFDGWNLFGQSNYTIVGGKITYEKLF